MRKTARAVAIVGVLAGSAFAQAPGTPPEPRSVTVSVEFAGGSMPDYVAALKKAAGGEAVNVVISGDSAKVALPPVSLRNASLDSAVMLLEMVELPQFDVDVGVAPDTSGTSRVFVVRTRYVGPTPAQREAEQKAAPVPTRIEVFSLRELLTAPPGTPADPAAVTTTDSLLSAAQTAMTLGGDAAVPELKFHPDSAVLVVRGTPYQLEAAQQVLREVRDDLMKYRESSRVARDREADLSRDVRECEVQIRGAEVEFKYHAESLARLREQVQAGVASREELAKAELIASQKQAQVEAASIRLKRAEDALRAFQQGAPPSRTPQSLKTPDQIRARMKAIEDELAALRDALKKMESSVTR